MSASLSDFNEEDAIKIIGYKILKDIGLQINHLKQAIEKPKDSKEAIATGTHALVAIMMIHKYICTKLEQDTDEALQNTRSIVATNTDDGIRVELIKEDEIN